MSRTDERISVAGYIRVSRIGGRAGEGYISPKEQRQAIATYAKQLGVAIPKDAWYEDQDYSGGNLDRPGWEAVVARIGAAELGGVVVSRIDRFARNVPDGAAQIRHVVDDLGAIFASAQEQMDPRTPTGRYMLQLFLNNAELQLNVLKSGWHSAKERAIARGAHIGPTPLGYRRQPKGSARSGCLTPAAEWRPIIAGLFERSAETGDGNQLLAGWANEALPRPDGKRWTSTTVGHILANRVYLGEVAYRPRTGDFAPLVNPDAHEPLVSEPTWLQAQRQPGTQRTRAGPVNILAGLVRCAACRYRMSPSRGGTMVRVYRCAAEHGRGRCPQPAVITAHLVEHWVLRQVQEQWETRFTVAVADARAPDQDDAAAALAEAQAELSAFAQDLTARRLLGDEYHPAMEARRAAVDAARATYEATLAPSAGNVADHLTWESLQPEELREVLAGAIDAVFVRRGRLPVDERALIVWAGELDEDLPGYGKGAAGIRPFAWPEEE